MAKKRRRIGKTPSETAPATMMTAAESTLATMLAHNIRTLYALPGVQNDHLFDAAFKLGDKLRTVHTRHKQGAAYMALGWWGFATAQGAQRDGRTLIEVPVGPFPSPWPFLHMPPNRGM